MTPLPLRIATSYTPVPDPPVCVVNPSIDNLAPVEGDTLTGTNAGGTDTADSNDSGAVA